MSGNKGEKGLVFVGLSGGVDSSVAAARLIKDGYRVVGVFIKVWQPEFLKCDAEQDRLDAMRVAAHLKIPFLTLDAAKEYKEAVGDYFVNEYLAGRTPNPDVMCNRHVKFGAFWRFAKAHGADYVATGHYARVEKDDTAYRLLRGVDAAKDQSYFLWTLTAEDLEHVLFPVGNSAKEEIRAEAKALKLPTAMKKDSQGICFLGHVDIKEFLSHFAELKPGRVLNLGGETVGAHDGALIYTVGQRHGFVLNGQVAERPHYVVAKDVSQNTITVDEKAPKQYSHEEMNLTSLNLINPLDLPASLEGQTRYRQRPFSLELEQIGDGKYSALVKEETEKPASGQSLVLYQGEVCLGGAVIE